MTPQTSDGWEAIALTLATATIVGLALAEQFRSLPAAVVAHGAAWFIGRTHRLQPGAAQGGAAG